MDEVNTRIYIVDRVDQARWYLDTKAAHTFVTQLRGNHHEIRRWLETMTQDIVVISGQGVMPRIGTTDHAYDGQFRAIQRDQYRLYFASEKDAMAFKLAWGGDCDL